MRAEFRQVSKSYNGHRALDGLTMDAPAGEVYGLVGPNGAGKTTAMKCLAGVLKPESGEVLADGEPSLKTPPSRGAFSASRTRSSISPRPPYWT